jgi:hypothetical protein
VCCLKTKDSIQRNNPHLFMANWNRPTQITAVFARAADVGRWRRSRQRMTLNFRRDLAHLVASSKNFELGGTISPFWLLQQR